MSGLRVITSFDDTDTAVILDSLETDLVLGKKYPLLDVPMEHEWDQERETKGDFFIRTHKLNNRPQEKEKIIAREKLKREKHVENKKYGYWDNMFSSTGANFKLQHADLVEKIRTLPPNENYISKMTYEGLAKSSPEYIHKVILIIRYPHNKKEKDFLEQTRDICKWFIMCPQVDVHVIHYQDCHDSPDAVGLRINHALGVSMKDLVDIPDYGEYPENVFSKICSMMLRKDYSGAYEECLREIEERQRGLRSWKCYRTGKKTTEDQCELCMKNREFRENLKRRAVKLNIDWMHLPCLYECGKSLDREPITFETSIKNNFWV